MNGRETLVRIGEPSTSPNDHGDDDNNDGWSQRCLGTSLTTTAPTAAQIVLLLAVAVAALVFLVMLYYTKQLHRCCSRRTVPAAMVPFVVFHEPDWKILDQSVEGYRKQSHSLLLQLSQAVASVNVNDDAYYPWEGPLLVKAMFQRRLRQLSHILEQDEAVIRDSLLLPFRATRVLPGHSRGQAPATTTQRSHQGREAPAGSVEGRPYFINKHKNKSNKGNNDLLADHSYDEAAQVVAHIVRDWTTEGQWIRASLYGWCCDKVQDYAISDPSPKTPSRQLSILVPGAGLGRLAYDLATMTTKTTTPSRMNVVVSVEAVEASLSMSAAAAAILQRRVHGSLHAYATDILANEVESERRYDQIEFPDVDLTDTTAADMYLSYTVSDFLLLPSLSGYQSNSDVIVTCYFIDTARNILDYIHAIRMLLKPRTGLWINVGPLQWHRGSHIPLAANELLQVIKSAGFEVLGWSIDMTPVEYRSSSQQRVSMSPPQRVVLSTHYDAYCPLRFVLKWKGEGYG
jgi:hypothetical protein